MANVKTSEWPRITEHKDPNGTIRYRVDLGFIDGKRKRSYYKTREEAETFAEVCRTQRENEGRLAIMLPEDVRRDAYKAHKILSPHEVTVLEAAKYYEKHVLAYKNAPTVKEVVERYIKDCQVRNLRPRTIGDLTYRLGVFAQDFGDSRLSDITVDELKEWVNDDEWAGRNRINFLTKVSQLYGFALRNRPKWVDANITELITRPEVDETKVAIFTVEQAKSLLAHAHEYGLLAYMAIGMFAGIRPAEMMRLTGKSINWEEKTITVGADAAKKRSQRVVDMQPALLAWIEPCKEALQAGRPIVDPAKLRKNKEPLLEAAGIEEWPDNGLRHSFGSYHWATWRDAVQTSYQMGNSVDMVHKHYKALVSQKEAEKFWSLRPDEQKPEQGQEQAQQA